MNMLIKLTRLRLVTIIFGFILGLMFGGGLPLASAMDTQLVLATEEIIREMRKQGELPPAQSPETETRQSETLIEEDMSLPEEGDLTPDLKGLDPEKLIVESSLVPVEEVAEIDAEMPAVPMKETLERRVSLKYVDADIRVVLRSLARAYGFNITLAPEVQGQVTLDFTNVRIIDALETILIDQGLGYQITGDIIRVTTKEKIQQETAAAAAQGAIAAQKAAAEAEKRNAEEAAEPLVVEIFALKFIDANDAKEAIEPMLTVGRGKAMVLQTKQYRGFEFEATETFGSVPQEEEAEAFVRSRTLIIQDTQAVLARIGSVITTIDHRPPQILIDAKVLEVPIDQESRLGINWTQALNGWTVGAKDLAATFDKHFESDRQNQIEDSRRQGIDDSQKFDVYDRGGREGGQGVGDLNYQGIAYPGRAENTLAIPSLIDWDLAETTGGPYQEGLAWRTNVQNVLRSRGYDNNQSRQIFDNYLNNVSDTLVKMATAGQTYSTVLNAADFSLMLSAMRTDSNVVVLSNPRIIVHENYAAKIFVGERYPILETQISGQDSSVGGTSVSEWREIGITLKVIPQVRAMLSGGESINMIIHPAVSKRTGQFAEYRDGLGNLAFSSYPIIDIREADTNVTISDGDTIVIGGLISSRTMDKVSKIPLLGDIPILGYIFKEEHSQVEKINLLIFITARIVTEETEFSAYEKLMLEKMPAEVLGDIHYVDDAEVRPYLYRGPVELEPATDGEKASGTEEGNQEPVEGNEESTEEAEAGNRGKFPGRVITRAMGRSQR